MIAGELVPLARGGLDPLAPSAGYGLPGMRERAETLGGQLHVRSAPVAGAPLHLRVPRGGAA